MEAIYLILRKLKGHNIKDVLQMPIPQFYCLVELVAKELEMTNKALKKGKKKSGK